MDWSCPVQSPEQRYLGRNQNAGEGAIVAIAASTGNWSLWGNGKVGGAGSFQNTSDRRAKNNIEDINLGSDFIKKLKPVSYKLNEDTDNKTMFGFVAQDILEVLDEYGLNEKNSSIVTPIGPSTGSLYTMGMAELISPLVKAVQELTQRIEELEAKISGSIW